MWAQRNSPAAGPATPQNKAIAGSMSNLEDKRETDLSAKESDETGKNKNLCFVHTRLPIPFARSLSQQVQVAGGQRDCKTALLTEWMATGLEEATLAINGAKSMHAPNLLVPPPNQVLGARLTTEPLFGDSVHEWIDRTHRSADLRYQRLPASGRFQKCKRTLPLLGSSSGLHLNHSAGGTACSTQGADGKTVFYLAISAVPPPFGTSGSKLFGGKSAGIAWVYEHADLLCKETLY